MKFRENKSVLAQCLSGRCRILFQFLSMLFIKNVKDAENLREFSVNTHEPITWALLPTFSSTCSTTHLSKCAKKA